MGEIAEMMLDGTMCSSCGEYLGTDNGYPTQCAGCGGEEVEEHHVPIRRHNKAAKVQCPFCPRKTKRAGLADHIQEKHPERTASAPADKIIVTSAMLGEAAIGTAVEIMRIDKDKFFVRVHPDDAKLCKEISDRIAAANKS